MRFLRQFGWIPIIAIALSIPLFGGASSEVASATPGGLDRYGGHHCWTNCASQGAYRGQYHCHRSTRACRRARARHRAHGH